MWHTVRVFQKINLFITNLNNNIMAPVTAAVQTKNFIYFAFNFPSSFISDVWSHDQHMANHLKAKLNSIVERSGQSFTSAQSFFSWFIELDQVNQLTLITWVNKNYNG